MQLDNWGGNGFTGFAEKLAGFSPSSTFLLKGLFFFFFFSWIRVELNYFSEINEIEATLNYNSYPYHYTQAL